MSVGKYSANCKRCEALNMLARNYVKGSQDMTILWTTLITWGVICACVPQGVKVLYKRCVDGPRTVAAIMLELAQRL